MGSVRLDFLLVVLLVLAVSSRSYAKPQVRPPSAQERDFVLAAAPAKQDANPKFLHAFSIARKPPLTLQETRAAPG